MNISLIAFIIGIAIGFFIGIDTTINDNDENNLA